VSYHLPHGSDAGCTDVRRRCGLTYLPTLDNFRTILASFIVHHLHRPHPLIIRAWLWLAALALLVALILGLIAWLVAAKEALDLPWLQTIVTVIVGFIVLVGNQIRRSSRAGWCVGAGAVMIPARRRLLFSEPQRKQTC
jgi:hypothetical protein